SQTAAPGGGRQRLWRITGGGALTCPGGQVLVVSAGQGHLSTASAASAVMAWSSSREPSHTTVNLVILPSWPSSSAAAPAATGWPSARHSYPPPWPAPATCRTDARA